MAHPDRRQRAHGRGFSLIELLVVVGVLALLIGILLPTLAAARRSGRQAVCAANLQQFGAATGAYAASFDERLFSLTWRRGHDSTRFAELRNADASELAAGRQVVEILRTKAGQAGMPDVAQEARDAGTSWTANIFYSHVTLHGFMGDFPMRPAACPEHRDLLKAQDGALAGIDLDFDGQWDPEHPDEVGEDGRFKWHTPFASSYEVVPAAYDRYQSMQPNARPVDPVPRKRIRNALLTVASGALSGYIMPMDGEIGSPHPRGQALGNVPIHRVRFPGQKVHMFDWFDRHSGPRERYYALPGAAQPMLFFDGSARALPVDEANIGWQPGRPEFPDTPGTAVPEQDTVTRFDGVRVPMRFKWTRGGLLGVDYGGSPLSQAPAVSR